MRWGLALLAFFGVSFQATAVEFAPPVRLEADKKIIRIEQPGFAAPTWADVNGDGMMDLVVGQFTGAKIQIFKNAGNNVLQAGEYLKANGKIAKDYGL
jgi:hypothetical protein